MITSVPSQTAIAQRFMTPESRGVIPGHILDAPIAGGTVASGWNNSIIFRVAGSGADRRFEPDSIAAAALLKTDAGPKLVRELEVAARTTDWAAGKTRLKGYILPR